MVPKRSSIFCMPLLLSLLVIIIPRLASSFSVPQPRPSIPSLIESLPPLHLVEMLKMEGQSVEGVQPVLKKRLERVIMTSDNAEERFRELEERIRGLEKDAYDTLRDLGL
mmetsp:Transcript_19993/g.41803  ORF Transcript_19993/g.41803 Transcript_19993/m.41803 type:complete len:110 (+) Transcript_19993:164-493(+)